MRQAAKHNLTESEHSLAMFTTQKCGLFLSLRHGVQGAVAWPGLGAASYAV